MMVWNKSRILQELRRLHKTRKDLSYNALARSMQSLVSAAAYHFGSYRRAVEQAGIDYTEVVRRPRWTRIRIIALLPPPEPRANQSPEAARRSAALVRGHQAPRRTRQGRVRLPAAPVVWQM